MTKTCPKCRKTKALSEFGKNALRKDGHTRLCKLCNNAYQRDLYARNRERYLAKRRRYRERHSSEALLWRYGITLDTYHATLEAQDNRCAICGKTPEENGKRICVDHDHETNEIRGLLCNRCNRVLGFVQDNPSLLRNAASYLEQHSKETDPNDD